MPGDTLALVSCATSRANTRGPAPVQRHRPGACAGPRRGCTLGPAPHRCAGSINQLLPQMAPGLNGRSRRRAASTRPAPRNARVFPGHMGTVTGGMRGRPRFGPGRPPQHVSWWLGSYLELDLKTRIKFGSGLRLG